MTPEQRFARMERVLMLYVKAGHRARKEFRAVTREQNEKINILSSTHTRNAEEWRAESNALNEKIGILIDVQMDTSQQIKKTDEQINRTDEQIKRTDEQIERLAAGQAKTDEALRRLINSLHKGQNGTSSK